MVLPPVPVASRQVLVWSLPTVAFVLSILWYRRRSRGSKPQTDPGGTKTSADPKTTVPSTAVVPADSSPSLVERLAAIEKAVTLRTLPEVQEEDEEEEQQPILSEVQGDELEDYPRDTSSVVVENSHVDSGSELSFSTECDSISSLEKSTSVQVTEIRSALKGKENQAAAAEPEDIKLISDVAGVQAVVTKSESDNIAHKQQQEDVIECVKAAVSHTAAPVLLIEEKQTAVVAMTEVEEQQSVCGVVKDEAGDSISSSSPSSLPDAVVTPVVLTKISVNVEDGKEGAEDVVKTKSNVHQPRDSANHSPAEAMLASPSISNDSDTHSVGSNDSGKGGSDVTTNVVEEEGGSGGKRGSRRTSTSSRSSASSSSEPTEHSHNAAVSVRPHTSTGASSTAPSNGSSTSPSDGTSASMVLEQAPHGSQASCSGQQPCIYEFVIPQLLVGRLIGKHGCFVQQIKMETNCSIFVKRHPESTKFKVCAIEAGTQHDIELALKLIRKKFPQKKYPSVTLERVMFLPPMIGYPVIPESLQMYLVECVNNDVILSSLVNAGHMFLQQPTHPTFPVLSRLIMSMTQCYTENESPTLPHPAPGIVCAAPSHGGWYRAEVIDVRTALPENTEEDSQEEEITVCDIKFVDYGGFMTLPASELRQIRTDFMTLPFQATECYLADIIHLDGEEGWSEEATQCVEELTRDQVLQAQVVGYTENSIPLIRLYSSIHGPMAVMVNEILVHRGLAKYYEA